MKKSRFVTGGGGKNKQKMLPSGHVQKSRILSSGFANSYKSVCNIHDCSHLRIELKPRIQSFDARVYWLPCVGNSSCHVCWTVSAIAMCCKF